MPDPLTPEQRHKCMQSIRGRATKPEMLVRRWLWSHGYRYRLNVKSVPGKADIVMRRYRTAIFVNGCFWHGHGAEVKNGDLMVGEGSCFKMPKSNIGFWSRKIIRAHSAQTVTCVAVQTVTSETMFFCAKLC